MTTVQANDSKLKKIVGSEAASAIQAICDPFHDDAINFRGIPSADATPIITQTLRHAHQISAPAGVVDTWSAVIFTTPFDNSKSMNVGRGVINGVMQMAITPAGLPQAYFSVPVSAGYQMNNGQLTVGPTTVWTFNTTVDQFFPTPLSVMTTPASHSSHSVLPQTDSSVRYRIVGHGFELTNTTAELYKQGTLTCVRSSQKKTKAQNVVAGINVVTNQSMVSSAVGNSAPISNYNSGSMDVFQTPPATIDDAMLNGALQWPAAEGAYVVSIIDNDSNAHTAEVPSNFALDTNNFQNLPSAVDPMPFSAITALVAVNNDVIPIAGSNTGIATPYSVSQHFTPRDCSAVYLQGLSPQSTFTLTVIYYVEMMPRIFDDGYAITVPMRHTPPDESQKGEFALSRLSKILPPGVMVKENPNGEFWASVVSGIGTLASIIGPTFGPEGALIGQIANAASKAVSQQLREKQQQKPVEKKKIVSNLANNMKRSVSVNSANLRSGLKGIKRK